MKYLFYFLIVIILTVLSQIGGFVFLLSLIVYPPIEKFLNGKVQRMAARFFLFLLLYIVSVMLIVPPLAKPFGRVPLPVTETDNIRPLSFLTWFFNRHYVEKELKETVIKVASKLNEKFPGTKVNYLDANFPFFDGFPLIPHLSHDDGEKLDLAFFYLTTEGYPTDKAPSFIGYGVHEDPLPGESDMPLQCKQQGYWQYDAIRKIVPQGSKNKFALDESRTRELIRLLARDKSIGKIFLEPHLRKRLKLRNSKIRFHGCQAVRHDDHIHVQLK